MTTTPEPEIVPGTSRPIPVDPAADPRTDPPEPEIEPDRIRR